MKIFLLLLSCSLFAFGQSDDRSYPVTAVDPKNTRDFPGGRGEHQLIVYTSGYGRPTTGTNQWGVEAIVRENVVIAIGGNNSPIRKGEYVLSGHGRARVFLQKTIKIGAKIRLSDSAVTVTFDGESFALYSSMRRSELIKKFERIKLRMSSADAADLRPVIDSISLLLRSTPHYSAELDSAAYIDGMRRLDELEYRISLSTTVEGRGVWHRPREKNREEIAATVKKLGEAGFNMIFLETIWRGETIYPGFITQQKKEFLGFDPLRVFIDEGKKQGIEIHAWIHTFFVGYVGASDDSGTGPILTANPSWKLIKRNGESVSRAEQGYLFVNPANPDAQNFIASLYREVRTNYSDLAGIQLDYIRYPVNVPLEESSDYSDYSRTEFQRVAGVDPMEINPADHPEKWEEWRRWREQVITNFVKRIRWENPETLLSADIFPDIEEAHKTKMQNWGEWAVKGYVNVLAPMAYTVNTEWITEAIGKMRSVVGEKFPLYVGLAPYLQLSPALLLQQIEQCRELQTHGVILFAASSLSDEQLRLLKIGPFRTPARPPELLRTPK